MALKTEKYRKYYLKCSNTFFADCITQEYSDSEASEKPWSINSFPEEPIHLGKEIRQIFWNSLWNWSHLLAMCSDWELSQSNFSNHNWWLNMLVKIVQGDKNPNGSKILADYERNDYFVIWFLNFKLTLKIKTPLVISPRDLLQFSGWISRFGPLASERSDKSLNISGQFDL